MTLFASSLTRLALVFAVLFACAGAFAQDKKKVKDAKLSFDDDDITGDLRRPTNSFLISRQKAKLPPLIKFREHFRKELHASTENY